ncbi:DUF742 domain-containing protein [Kitasatospora mediocidica]|uniref:DUF742 domain-containing protein n=1 Tax=Kitasatospora mediocidica TaxID=58352 RepID=UPI0005660D2C|nr:DUF742 domain-containing protein [Kitasatospora mediocidica]
MSDSARTGTLRYDEDLPLGPRPYTLTRGRTQPGLDLALEALVSNVRSEDGAGHGQHRSPGPDGLGPEHRAIRELCRQSRSVAEIAALLPVPLGVARILVADLAGAGLVLVDQSAAPGGQPDTLLLERVLGGLRNL